MGRRRRLRIIISVAAVLAALAGGHRLLVSRALYRLNLNASVELEELPVPRKGQHILVFAPHEDDETLGCGGYIQQAVEAGASVHVVLITNGEYPELSMFLSERTLRKTPERFIKLGYLRQQETLAATGYLGVDPREVTFLGYPNNYLDRMWLPANWSPQTPVRSVRTHATRSPYANSMTPGAVYCGQSVLDDVAALLRNRRPDVVVTVESSDVHVDHWPTYAFVKLALAEMDLRGDALARQTRLYGYLIHRPHWPVPRSYRPWLRLEPPALLATTGSARWYSLPMSLQQALYKHTATGLYHTQGGSIDPLLLSFSRTNELFAVTPDTPWTAGANVAQTPVLSDPKSDLDATAATPSGDIVQVGIGRRGGTLLAGLVTAGHASNHLTYHISIHWAAAAPEDRVVAHYEWRGTRGSGTVLTRGAPQHLARDGLRCGNEDHSATLSAPWPYRPDRPCWLLVRAWSMHRGRIIDQTSIATVRVPPLQPSPEAEARAAGGEQANHG